jgi:hypothetical protein
MKIIVAAFLAAGLALSFSAAPTLAKGNGGGHPTIHPSQAVKDAINKAIKNSGGSITVEGGDGPLHGGSQGRPDSNGGKH